MKQITISQTTLQKKVDTFLNFLASGKLLRIKIKRAGKQAVYLLNESYYKKRMFK